MGFTWNSEDIASLADPNFIDRLGHYVHNDNSNHYKFSMNVMGYQAMYYTKEFEDIVKSESSIKVLKTEIKQVCRGIFGKNGTDGWEVSFRAEALIRNDLNSETNLPIGEVDYATDLIYSNTILFSLSDTGNKIFERWAHNTGLIQDVTKTLKTVPQHINELPVSLYEEQTQLQM